MIDIEQLKALEKAATPRPWETSETHPDAVVSLGYTDIDPDHWDWYHGLCVSESSEAHNADFICAMRNALPDLLALLEEARRLALCLKNIDTREVFDFDHLLRQQARAFLSKFETKREG